MKSVYDTLRTIDVSEHIEKKNGLSYLSWAWAWDTLMSLYPQAYVNVHRDLNGRFWFDDGRTAWVEVDVTIDNMTRSELFPIMDYKNKSIPADKVTSFDANTAVQRATTKAIARHGLGLYVYAGEDLPPTEEEVKAQEEAPQKPQKPAQKKPKKDPDEPITEGQAAILKAIVNKYGNDAMAVIEEYNNAMEIPKGQKYTAIQAAGLMQTFFARGMRNE